MSSARQSSPTPRTTTVRASTRGAAAAAANNNAAATSAASSTAAASASAAPRSSGRSTPTAANAAVSAPAASAAAAAASVKRKRDADDRAADSPAAGGAGLDAAAADVSIDARSALTTLETIPLCFTSPLYRQGKIIRLTRVHTHATAEAAAAYAQAAKSAAAASAAAASSSAAAAASSASSSASSSALLINSPDTTSYIRASDLAQLFLSSKNAVSAYLSSFSSPHEKVLMRVPGQRTGGDVLLFTRKGLKRALLTRQLRADVSLSRWVQDILLEGVMAHGSKGLLIPAEAMRPPRSSSDSMEDVGDDDDEGETKQQSEEEIAAARKKRMLALPKPNRETLAAWVAASLSTATALHKSDSDREAKLAAIAAASPAQQRGGSSAGKNWAGHAFADKRTRVGLKFQALVPDRLSYAQQKANLSVDDPRFADEELVYSPSLPQPRWAPFSDWPRLRPEDPASRRYARAQWDAEQLEARRSTRRMDGDPGDGVLSLVSGSMAQRFERELAGMQREERIKVESKILASALRQLNRFVFKQDRGARDFESVFLSTFHEWGSIERIFLFDLPQPGRDLKEEAFEVTAARFVPAALWTEARDRDARDAAARAVAKRRRTEGGSAGGAGGSLYTPSVAAPLAAANAAAAAAASASTAPASATTAASSSAATGLPERNVHLNGLHPRAHLPPSSAAAAAAMAPAPLSSSSSALAPSTVSASGLYVPSASATRGLLTLNLPQPPPTSRPAALTAVSSYSAVPRPLPSPHAPPPHRSESKQPDSLLGSAFGGSGLSPSAARPPSSLVSPPPSASLLSVRLPSAPPKSKPLNALGLRASLAPPPPSIAQMQQKQLQQAQQQSIASR